MARLDLSEVLLVDPTGEAPDSQSLNLAPRPTDLRGKRLGLLDNSKANSDVILRAIKPDVLADWTVNQDKDPGRISNRR